MEQETTQEQAPKKGSSMPVIAAVVILIIAAAGLFLFNNMKSSQQPTVESTNQTAPTAMAQPTEAASDSAMTMEASSPIAVEGGNFYFKPNKITVKKGQKVTIVFNNKGGMHDFVIDEFNAKTSVVASGKSETITFVADKVGTYEFYCGVGNHRAMGMKGTLVVE